MKKTGCQLCKHFKAMEPLIEYPEEGWTVECLKRPELGYDDTDSRFPYKTKVKCFEAEDGEE
jgi:hypothetical protein